MSVDMHMKEDAWGVAGLLHEGEKVVRRLEYRRE